MVTRTLLQLAAELNGEVVGDGSIEIRDVAGIREALPGDITFIANSRYDAYLDETHASAVICGRETQAARVPLLRVTNPYLAFQQAVRIFRPDRDRQPAGVHPTAVVAHDAALGSEVSVGPWCVVESGARLGDRVVLMAHSYVGPRVEIGEDTRVYPRVTIRE